MLLNGSIKNDHRVIKMINTLSKKALVDLYYINGSSSDNDLFNENVYLFSFKHKNSIKRKFLKNSFFCFEFNYFIKKVLKKNKSYNYIWSNDLPTLYSSFKLSKKLNAKLIYDSHEIYIETLNQFFPENNRIFKRIIFKILLKFMKIHGLKIEKKCINKVQTFVTVNESLQNYFIKKYKLKNCISIMNYPESTFANKQAIDFRKKYNWSKSDIILIYQGTINKGRGLDILIESLKITPSNYKLVIIGDGTIKENLIQKTKELQICNKVKFINKVPINELHSYSAGADIGINLLENYNLSKKLASPNKLFEYIHAEIPVLCSDTIENKNILSKYKIGLLTNNNSKEILNTITNFSLENLNTYKYSLILAKKEFVWEKQERKILSLIK